MLVDNPMVAPEPIYKEPASLDDTVNYDRDADFLEKVIQENTGFNMVDYANNILGKWAG